jgi:hypothetical protein
MYDDILGKREEKVKLKEVTVKWEPVVNSNKVIGYNLYYRKLTSSDFNIINVGNNTTYVLSLRPDTAYELSVTAYDIDGKESKHSERVMYNLKGQNETQTLFE